LYWTEVRQETLEKLKQLLVKAAESSLISVDFTKPFDIFVDASDKAVSGTLTQQDSKGHYLPVAFFSQKLNETH